METTVKWTDLEPRINKPGAWLHLPPQQIADYVIAEMLHEPTRVIRGNKESILIASMAAHFVWTDKENEPEILRLINERLVGFKATRIFDTTKGFQVYYELVQ